MNGGHFAMISSLSFKDMTVTKCPPFIRTNLSKSNNSLPAVDNKYSFTRAHNVLASLTTSITSLDFPSYWYTLSDNGKGRLCKLFRLKY